MRIASFMRFHGDSFLLPGMVKFFYTSLSNSNPISLSLLRPYLPYIECIGSW
jgi:hypothetical protein